MRIRHAVFAATLTAAFAGTAQAQLYTITDIGVLPGGSFTSPSALNDAGQVVGYGNASAGNHAFSWRDGVLSDIGIAFSANSQANGVNNAGAVVVTSSQQSFVYQNGAVTALAPLPGAQFASGADINNVGQVVGVSGTFSGPAQGVIWGSAGSIQTLGALSAGWSSTAIAINDLGRAVGTSTSPTFQQRAVTWGAAGISDLGVLPGRTSSAALGINNLGQIVGRSGVSNVDQAVVWNGGSISLLNPLNGARGGSAYAINEAGQIVGYSDLSGDFRATMWSNGTTYDLSSVLVGGSNWVLSQALDINESGQITGVGFIGGQSHAFLLTPVPELGTAALLLSGLGPVLVIRRRRRDRSGNSGLRQIG